MWVRGKVKTGGNEVGKGDATNGHIGTIFFVGAKSDFVWECRFFNMTVFKNYN